MAKTLGLDSVVASFLLFASIFMPNYDFPLVLTFSLYISLFSRRLYLFLISLFLPSGLKLVDLVDQAFFYRRNLEIGGTSFELFIRLWMVWTTIVFAAVWLFFLMIEAGAMIYGVSFTLKICFLEIFSIERVNNLFKTEFNPINAFIFSLLLSIVLSLVEVGIRE